MSSGTTFRIFRRFNEKKIEAEELESIRKRYLEENNSCSKSESYPKIARRVGDDCDNYESEYIDLSNGCICKLLMSFDFGSSLDGTIREHYNLSPYDYDRSTVHINRDEAKKILQSIEYLENGEYSDKIERIMRNSFIDLFGDKYPKYYNQKYNRQNTKYIQKIMSGEYSISDGGYEYNKEIEDEKQRWDFNFILLKSCLMAFIYSDNWSYNNSYELILEILAW